MVSRVASPLRKFLIVLELGIMPIVALLLLFMEKLSNLFRSCLFFLHYWVFVNWLTEIQVSKAKPYIRSVLGCTLLWWLAIRCVIKEIDRIRWCLWDLTCGLLGLGLHRRLLKTIVSKNIHLWSGLLVRVSFSRLRLFWSIFK